MFKFTINQTNKFAILLQITRNDPQADAIDLVDLEFPELDGDKGLVISGFHQWATAAIAVKSKNHVQWIAIVDSNLQPEESAIIIWSLNRDYYRGDIIPLSSLGLNSPVAVARN